MRKGGCEEKEGVREEGCGEGVREGGCERRRAWRERGRL